MPSCLVLERHAVCRALPRAWAKTGKRMAARMAIMAITTSNSISVKPFGRGFMSGTSVEDPGAGPALSASDGRFAGGRFGSSVAVGTSWEQDEAGVRVKWL